MPMYNLLEYSSNYPNTTGSLWFYSKDKASDFRNDIVNSNEFKYFKYKAKLLKKHLHAATTVLGDAKLLYH